MGVGDLDGIEFVQLVIIPDDGQPAYAFEHLDDDKQLGVV